MRLVLYQNDTEDFYFLQRLEYQQVVDEMVMLKGAETFTLENHTECECKPLQQLPE